MVTMLVPKHGAAVFLLLTHIPGLDYAMLSVTIILIWLLYLSLESSSEMVCNGLPMSIRFIWGSVNLVL